MNGKRGPRLGGDTREPCFPPVSVNDGEEPAASAGNCSREPAGLGGAQAGTEGTKDRAARLGTRPRCRAPRPALRPGSEFGLQLPGCTAPRAPPRTLPTPPPPQCPTRCGRSRGAERGGAGAGQATRATAGSRLPPRRPGTCCALRAFRPRPSSLSRRPPLWTSFHPLGSGSAPPRSALSGISPSRRPSALGRCDEPVPRRPHRRLGHCARPVPVVGREHPAVPS